MKRFYFLNIFLGLIALLSIVFVFTKFRVSYQNKHEIFMRNLLEVKNKNSKIKLNLLISKHEILNSYDLFVINLEEINRIQIKLEKIPVFIDVDGKKNIQEKLEVQAKNILRMERLIEEFKSKNAILKNSVSYLPILSDRLIEEIEFSLADRELERQIHQLIDDILLYTLNSDEEMIPEIQNQIEYLSNYTEAYVDFQVASTIQTFIVHSNIILKYQPKVKTITNEFLELPLDSSIDEIYRICESNYISYNRDRNNYIVWCYSLILILVIWIFERIVKKISEAREAALEGSRLKSQFLANMSHEIRTPMNAVLGIVELLFRTHLTLDQKDLVQTLQTSAKNLLMILNDILDLSKLEAGEMHLESLDLDLEVCLVDVVNLLKPRADSKGIKLIVDLDDKVPRKLRGDGVRLRQILLNTIGNAIKFTDVGEVEVRVSLAHEMIRGSPSRSKDNLPQIGLRFQVRDTGIGIQSQDLPKLFQFFSQVDASTSRQYEGTGLGLAICKQLVELMGGEMGVESEVNLGSTFWFTALFEQRISPEETITHDVSKIEFTSGTTAISVSNLEADADQHLPKLTQLKILVVEDNPVNRKVLLRLLQLLGYHADFATNGREALDRLQQGDRDLVFMDCQMPILDGYETTRELRRREGKGRHTMVIALTAHAMKGDREKCLDAGMDDYLTKPVDLEALKAKLEQWTERFKAPPPAQAQPPKVAIKTLVDLHRLDDISDGDVEFQQELLEIFVGDTEEKLAQIQQALQEEDFETVVSHAHSLKGASSNMGIASMQAIAAELEYQARENRLARSTEKLAILEQTFKEVKAFSTEFPSLFQDPC